jgi:hypothetical protein
MPGADGDPFAHEWESGWEGHEEAQRRRLAALPLQEKLAWLEEAHRLVQHMTRDRAPGRPPGDAPAAD